MSRIERIPHGSHWGAYWLLEAGRIVGVEPFEGDPDPSPIIKSVAAWADPHRRVMQPMARKSWLAARRAGRLATVDERARRGRDTFTPISWDEALSLTANEIRRVIADHGNRSIFAGSYGWTSSGRFHHASTLLRRTLNLVGGFTGHADTYSIAAGPVILRHTLGNTDACQGRANTLENVAKNAETLVVFGAMATRTAQSEAGGIAKHRLAENLRAIAERGVRVILVSPQRDDLPDWLGAEWWPIKPNTDTALMLALAQEIVGTGRHDAEFLARHCSGSELYLDYLSGTTDGTPKTAEWAAAITGLEPAQIRALADTLVRTRSMLSLSWSLQRASHGEQPFWSALGLAAVAGQIGKPGGGVAYGYGSLGGVGGPVTLSKTPAMSQLSNDLDSFIPVARVTDMLESPGKAYDYEGKTRHYPDIRMVYWAGGNPYHHHQDLNRLERAWALPETIVVQDPMWTPTALRADIVLPATTSIERNDLAGNRRSDTIVAMRKAIDPIGEARSDFDIFSGLAAKLGVRERFTEGRDEMAWVRHLYEATRQDAKERCNFDMPDFDTFWEAGTAAIPTITDQTHLAAYRADPEKHVLATESGRIVLGSALLTAKNYADCRPHPAWLPPAEWLDPAAEKAGAFHMLTPQPDGRLHSQLVHAGPSHARMPDGRERLRINPVDAKRLDLKKGDVARVWNGRGACLAVAEPYDGIRQGVVALPTGAWLTPGGDAGAPELAGNPNVLTPDIPTSSLGQGCAAQTCLVHVERWRGNDSVAA
ncbi:MAG TPA: molybdopterin-dependent oxidoreductase, partial [Hyphomicrobiaceae bacterium]|nr:molybdopterin-dependent oxidoreductase [Hyphomicrobiaceae bacterium]